MGAPAQGRPPTRPCMAAAGRAPVAMACAAARSPAGLQACGCPVKAASHTLVATVHVHRLVLVSRLVLLESYSSSRREAPVGVLGGRA